MLIGKAHLSILLIEKKLMRKAALVPLEVQHFAVIMEMVNQRLQLRKVKNRQMVMT